MNPQNNKNHENGLLARALNMMPGKISHIHLMGICGTAMASLAGMLKQKGYHITGSDQNIYPPMSDMLERLSIPVNKGYRPENLFPVPDLVIVGNVITRQNPEAVELGRLKIPYLSMPQALGAFAIRERTSIVVSGTHGKTTTSSLVSHLLEKAGLDPGFMIGGIVNNFRSNFKIGNGPYFVVEGDEYDTAFFDKGPKFLHYKPRIVILTSIEFDHADIFRDLDHVIETFRRLTGIIPPDGFLIANRDDRIVMQLAESAVCRVTTYGLEGSAAWGAADVSVREGMTHLTIIKDDKPYTSLKTPLYGKHNISNLLSVAALSEYINLDKSVLSEACRTFTGVKRRQEVRGEKNGIIVIDDFAHHPTAVEKTVKAVKERYKGRRLLAVFEPRSNSSRRNVFQEQYGEAFDNADLIFIPEPVMLEKIPEHERFSSRKLVERLVERGLKAFYSRDSALLLEEILKFARTGDVILIMSNGAFDNIHEKILERL
ncbi:MAG: UDP-N-acetylmuramate:L-alanyl-gamma-D-glutamyl-meso-diaminopimelate ligase [Deltaproteobacteria bacterium]|nr:UDP-N-acetylmuramate:L-alanyl-gamma-D-glutamyl-meso-diaminopimelate ligase [Deltaproteobacteria bacterium]